jgi:cysteine-rich repeat protein
MNNITTRSLLALATGVALLASPAVAQPTKDSLKCAAGKLKSTGKDAAAKLNCYQKAWTAGDPVDPACLDSAQIKFEAAWQKSEDKGGCATEGAGNDALVLADDPDPTGASLTGSLLNDLVAALDPGGVSKCQAAKAKEAGKAASAVAGCVSKAATKGLLRGLTTDDPCIDKAIDKLLAAYDKAELGTDCTTNDDGNDVAARILGGWLAFVSQQIPNNDGCGSGFLTGSETCDDGNVTNEDDCPSDCIIATCDPTATITTATVSFAGAKKTVGGITVFVDYHEGLAHIPGIGAGIPSGVIHDIIDPVPNFFPTNTAFNDREHALTAVLAAAADPGPPASVEAFGTSGDLMQIDFEGCTGQPAPVTADFSCTVVAAAGVDGKAETAATCSVTVP